MRKLALAVGVSTAAGIGMAVLLAPSSYRLERAVVVRADPAAVRGELGDLQRWPSWAPGGPLDPRVGRRFGGRPGSPGATFYWSGPGSSAGGRMTVVGVGPDRIDLEVEVEHPRRTSFDLEFRIAPEGEGTRVTASLSGDNDALDRARWFLAGRRASLGGSLEDRLAGLRSATEALPRNRNARLAASSVIAASPEAVRARITDLRSWQGFAPWAGHGFATARFGGPASGVGASAYWSEPDTGDAGRMTIVSDSPEGVDVELEVEGPGARLASNDVELRLAPDGIGTRVTWTWSGDGGVEPADLDRGLARLKALAEGNVR